MVQSIWLQFKEEDMNEDTINEVVKTVKDTYRTTTNIGYPYNDDKFDKRDVHVFDFIDYREIKEVVEKIGLDVDDDEKCQCGCFNTEFELIVKYINLEFMHGQMEKFDDMKYYRLGRDVWGSVGMFGLRLNVLRYILEEIQNKLDEKGIDSELDMDDCEKHHFHPYEYWKEGD